MHRTTPAFPHDRLYLCLRADLTAVCPFRALPKRNFASIMSLLAGAADFNNDAARRQSVSGTEHRGHLRRTTQAPVGFREGCGLSCWVLVITAERPMRLIGAGGVRSLF